MEEVDSGDSGDDEAAAHASLLAQEAADEEAANEAEPAEERRVRLAKEMLAAMDQAAARRDEDGAFAGASGVARGAHAADLVADALEEDALRRAGQWRWLAASGLRGVRFDADAIRRLRGPRLSPTSVAISPDESYVVCGCKDGALVRWELPSGSLTKLAGGRGPARYGAESIQLEWLRSQGGGPTGAGASGAGGGGVGDGGSSAGGGTGLVDDDDDTSVGSTGVRSGGGPASSATGTGSTNLAALGKGGSSLASGHESDVLAVSISADGRLIASGGKDGQMLLWDCRTNTVVHQFGRTHRGAVRALVRRRDLDGDGGGELYSASTDRTARVWDWDQRGYVETLYGHQEAITALDALGQDLLLSASEDRTVRLWKVAEETQLLFANGHGAPVDACAMLHTECFASGAQDGSLTLWSAKRKRYLATVPLAHGSALWGGPCWISALASPAYSDVLISGSCDGHVRFWHADEAERQLAPLCSAPVPGFVNALSVAPSGKFVACAVGQEHRLGRWFKVPAARNSLCLIAMPKALHVKPKLSVSSAARAAMGKAMVRRPLDGGKDGDEDDDEADE